MPERDQIAARARAIAAGRSGGGRQGDLAVARDAEGVHAGRRAAAFHVANVNRGHDYHHHQNTNSPTQKHTTTNVSFRNEKETYEKSTHPSSIISITTLYI